MYSKRSIFSTILLILLVATTSWFSIKNQKFQTPNILPEMVSETILNAAITKMNHQGQIQYQAHADHITKLQNGKTFLTAIHGILYPKNRSLPPWQIRANKGELTQSNRELTLSDDVVIYRQANALAAPYRLTTNTLHIFPHQHYARTSEPVTIYQPGTPNVTTGIGMTADMHTKTITLLSDVHSTYDTHAKYTKQK